MRRILKSTLPFLVLLVIAGCIDPNEPGVDDCKDFKDADVSHVRARLMTDVEFYDAMCLNEFFYYFDTDTDPAADFLVRCNATEFTVSKESATSPGLYDDLKYTGTPVVSGVHYRLEFPLSAIEATATVRAVTLRYWFYAMDGKDRMPDTGEWKVTVP